MRLDCMGELLSHRTYPINIQQNIHVVKILYSFSTLVTHCLCDLITIVDNIHRELNNQVKEIFSPDIPETENRQNYSVCNKL